MRTALRTAIRSPGFSLLAVFTLALGVSASTTLFSVVNAVLIEPLPYRDADRLVVVRAEQDFDGASRPSRAMFPTAAVAAWPPIASLERVAFYAVGVASIAGSAASELVDTAVVTTSFFETVAGDLVLGRALLAADDLQPTAVISRRLWERRFGGSAAIIGESLVVNGQRHTIVGVAAETFHMPQPQTDVWLPAGFAHARNPACCGFVPIARMAKGVVLAAASDEIQSLVSALAAEFPRALSGTRTHAIGLHDSIVRETRPTLMVLAAAVGLLLLTACANVTNLLLARNSARIQETAIRRALGASRGRLVKQSLAESLVLATAAAAAGVVLSVWSLNALKAWPPAGLPRVESLGIDPAVLAFGCALAISTTVVVGLLSALQSADPVASLKGIQPGRIGTQGSRRTLRAVTVAQLAVSMVLLVGAVLLGRSLVALMGTDLGVEPDRVATASLNLAMDRTLTDREQVQLVERVVERIGSLPQVMAAGVGTARPPDASRMRLTLNRTGEAGARASFQAAAVPVTPGYFAALGIRLERGRFFTAADDGVAPAVAIMSRDTARQLFGTDDALGRTIDLPALRNGASTREQMTVVGIAGNVKYSGLDQVADAVVYRPFAQQPWRSVFLVARTAGDPAVLASRFRSEVGAVDRFITIGEVATMNAVLSDLTAQPRFRAALLTSLAVLAMVIAAVGLYAVIRYSLSQRTAEIGVRLALGASRRQIRTMVLREGMGLAMAGTALGAAGAYGLTRLLTSLLFGITPTDVTTFALAAAGIVTASLVAVYVPAARAARTDPVVVLRGD
jgi:predicted permease